MSYILLAIGAACCFGVATALQKRVFERIPRIKADWWIKDGKIDWNAIRDMIRKVLCVEMIVGVLLGLVGWVGYAKSMSMGDVTIIQPLMNVATLITVGIGVYFLKERLKSYEWAGIALVLIGAVLVSMSA